MAVDNEQLVQLPRLCLCTAIKTCLSHANSMSSLLQPEGDEVTNTSCFLVLIASTQADWMVLLVDWYIMPGGNTLPSAQTVANKVIHLQELF
jgi:hypothetical protein